MSVNTNNPAHRLIIDIPSTWIPQRSTATTLKVFICLVAGTDSVVYNYTTVGEVYLVEPVYYDIVLVYDPIQ